MFSSIPMNPYDSNGDFDREWDERGDLSWNEFDWQRYLQETEEEISRFLSLYRNTPESLNRLDDIARLMGWEQEDDWAYGDPPGESAAPAATSHEHDPDDEEWEPYTLHQHPVYIVTKGLYNSLGKIWEYFLKSCPGRATPSQCWRYARSLNEGETTALMALQALDMGDYTLSLCLFKQVLRALNQSLRLLGPAPASGLPGPQSLFIESRRRLFDLREVFLRVMQDCREEIQNRPPGDD